MEQSSPDECAICKEDIYCHPSHELECHHAFHAHCIVAWFRTRDSRGRCPMCRDGGGHDEEQEQDGSEDGSEEEFVPIAERRRRISARVSRLRRKALRHDAPARLKRLVRRIREAEEKERVRIRDVREFVRSEEWRKASTASKKCRRLKRLRWLARSGIQLRKQRLLEYGSDTD